MFWKDRKDLALVAGVLILAAVGAAAWIHNSETTSPAIAPAALGDVNGQPIGSQPAQSSYAAPQGGYTAPPAQYAEPRAGYATTQTTQGSNYVENDGYYATTRRPVYVRQPVQQQEVVNQPVERRYVERDREAYSSRSDSSQPQYRRGRTKAHSVEIVAGTAAAGAAIGAIAGGGKGAALGGLSGAGAGFVYDRLTHNH